MSREAESESRSRALAAALAGAGLSAWGLVSRPALEEACARLPQAVRAKFGVDAAKGAVAAALAYGTGPRESPTWAQGYGGPPLSIARFARADWYAELSSRLRAAAARTRESLAAQGLEPGAARNWRHLANSGLPEKPLALAAGLGRLGRNGLVIVRAEPEGGGVEIGPGVVLGLLLLPFEPCLPVGWPEKRPGLRSDAGREARPGGRLWGQGAALPEAFILGGLCGSCRACVEACPTGALGEDGAFARERCIQHWTAREGALPPAVEAAWGDRLYGCEACLEACPFYRPEAEEGAPGRAADAGFVGAGSADAALIGAAPAAGEARGGAAPSSAAPACFRGALGPSLPAGFFLTESEAAIRERLRGTALGLGWMSVEAFRRSARLALSRRKA